MISLVFDVVIAILLIVTIAFCVLLGRRLKRLRADEDMMRAVVTDIVQSTGKAEHAIRTLKATADECEHTLGQQLREAQGAIGDLKTGTSSAETAARRLAEIVAIVKSASFVEKPAAPSPHPAANMPENVTEFAPAVSIAQSMTDMPAPEPEMVPQPEPVAQKRVSALDALRARAA